MQHLRGIDSPHRICRETESVAPQLSFDLGVDGIQPLPRVSGSIVSYKDREGVGDIAGQMNLSFLNSVERSTIVPSPALNFNTLSTVFDTLESDIAWSMWRKPINLDCLFSRCEGDIELCAEVRSPPSLLNNVFDHL